MRIKPTKRENGRMMCTYRIRVDIGIHDVIRAMLYNYVSFGTPLEQSRSNAMRQTVDFFSMYGQENWERVDSEMIKEFGTRCAARARELFPELAAGEDLSGWDGADPELCQ
jgi:hypothetical protein